MATVQEINQARLKNVSAGLPAYSGEGATITNPTPTLSTNVYGGGAETAVGISQNGTTPITSENLQEATPLSIPSPDISTKAESLLGTADGVKQSALQTKIDAEAQTAKENLAGDRGSLENLQTQMLDIMGGRSQAEITAKLPEKQTALATATNQIEASQRAQVNELRAVEGQGLTDVQKGATQREINRRYAFEQADLALIQSAANRDYVTAQSIVDRKIELQLEPLKTKLDFQKIFYQDNKDTFTKAEDRQIQNLITQSTREYDIQKELKTSIGKIQLTAAQNGADASTINAIGNAKDLKSAITVAGNYGINQADVLDLAIKKQQLIKAIADNNGTGDKKIVKVNGVDYMQDSKGNLTVPKTPETAGQSEVAQTMSLNNIANMDSILKSSGLSARVGTNFLSRKAQGEGFFGGLKVAAEDVLKIPLTLGVGTFKDIASSVTGAGQDFSATVHQVTDQLTLDKLIQSKAAGATFGALSDSERVVLANAATKLNNWEIKDSKGNGTGVWNISESAFKKEIETIKNLAQKDYNMRNKTASVTDVNNYLDTIDNVLQGTNSPYSTYLTQ